MMYYCTAYDKHNEPIMAFYVEGNSEDEALETFDWLLYSKYPDVLAMAEVVKARVSVREAEHDEEV